MFVSIYNIESCYGGPEEGGWWYDWYRLFESFEVATREEADRLRSILDEYCKQKNDSEAMLRHQNTANMPEGNSPWLDTEGYIPKGWGDGGKVRILVEAVKGESSSTEVPYYC